MAWMAGTPTYVCTFIVIRDLNFYLGDRLLPDKNMVQSISRRCATQQRAKQERPDKTSRKHTKALPQAKPNDKDKDSNNGHHALLVLDTIVGSRASLDIIFSLSRAWHNMSSNDLNNSSDGQGEGAINNTPAVKKVTLHEHLHQQLAQLISVTPPSNNNETSSESPAPPPIDLLDTCTPHELLVSSKNEERRVNKLAVVKRLTDTLRLDQTSSSGVLSSQGIKQKDGNKAAYTGKIHGCVGSHWDLLPPEYSDETGELDNNNRVEGSSSSAENNTNAQTKGDVDDDTIAAPSAAVSKISPTVRGGGLSLPGLDWNKTFKKGYSVLVWVRPTLMEPDCNTNFTTTNIPSRALPRKQVLYRFATSETDDAKGSIGVCAILGQWSAVKVDDSQTMLTATVTAYTLPNADPMAYLYPAVTDDDDTIEVTAPVTSMDDGKNNDSSNNNSKDGKKPEKRRGRDRRATIEFRAGSARNMEHFQKRHNKQKASNPAASTTTDGRLSNNKAKQTKKKMATPTNKGNHQVGGGSEDGSNRVCSAQLTLPADEWSLVSIQHTHPYLRRPELSISVNGEEMLKGELGFPMLDGVIDEGESPVRTPLFKRSNNDRQDKESTENLNERLLLQRHGILAECSLLDGVFDNGVQVASSDSETVVSCKMSVHSLALLSTPPVPNAVLAVAAERGPVGDMAPGSGLSFFLAPVPPIPQNREAIVALSAGHGYYGSGGSGGNGGSGRRGNDGLMGNVGGFHGDLANPRSLGLPVSVGITQGVYPLKGSNRTSHGGKSHDELDPSRGDALLGDTWIGSGEEDAAHIGLQGLLASPTYTFHSGDTMTLGGVLNGSRKRIVCPPSAAPSRIGGADSVPKVGIVRPTPPNPPISTSGLEITGNAQYHNVTRAYLDQENSRCPQMQIAASLDGDNDSPPVSFSRYMQSSDAISLALLPFRLALPRAGNEEVNDMQRTLRLDSFSHLNDLLSNDANLAGRLIEFIGECIRCSGGSMKDEALQNGIIHVVATLVRKVLIRGARLGLLNRNRSKDRVSPRARMRNRSTREDFDYDQDHESSCPPMIPTAIYIAIVGLIDVCCGPALETRKREESVTVPNPYRGLLRVRRASDFALTAFFGLAMDFDLFGNDPLAAAFILKAVSKRYCPCFQSSSKGSGSGFNSDDYGTLLRKQINLQYFLDMIRVRLDKSVTAASHAKANGNDNTSMTIEEAYESIAVSLSDILYSMLVTTLTSSAGPSITLGERDVGALVATLTECPLGSICAHVVTTSIARLLVKCGAMSPSCLRESDSMLLSSNQIQKKKSSRKRSADDAAMESRFGRNMMICHYHDIVAPLLLSRILPRKKSPEIESNEGSGDREESCTLQPAENAYLLDWTYHWRLSLLTYTWLCSNASEAENKSLSTKTGQLLLSSANAGYLDHGFLGKKSNRDILEADILATLSEHLVLQSPSDKGGVNLVIKRAEATSRRLSTFMTLVPGISLSLLSSSMAKPILISSETADAAEMLKDLLTMLSHSIQALYGSKKGGLLAQAPGSKSGAQLAKAKNLFVAAAKEYAPYLLKIVIMLIEPIRESRALTKSKSSVVDEQAASDVDDKGAEQPESRNGRDRSDSVLSEKDWVDVNKSTRDQTSTEEPSPRTATSSSSNSGPSKNETLEQRAFRHLSSCQDIALYAVSRLIAQAMKYGGGEASTTVWRFVILALSEDYHFGAIDFTEDSSNVESAADETKTAEKQLSKNTLCHLAALVLSKFARHHDRFSSSHRSPWNTETCSAVARLMDLIEEKQLLSCPDQVKGGIDDNEGGSTSSKESSSVSRKYSIDQVRLLKALLEIMESGRESGGWAQIEAKLTGIPQNESSDAQNEDGLPANAHTKRRRSMNSENSKLLLPILQSCLRIVIPCMGMVRSEAVVISSSSGTSAATSVLLELISTELHLSLESAISGLGFPVSRDIFMNATASLRRSIASHKSLKDAKAVMICCNLLLAIVDAMRIRYLNERSRVEKASYGVYEDDKDVSTSQNDGDVESYNGGKEGINSQVVEKLILGEDILPNGASDADFVTFPGNDNIGDEQSTSVTSSMGWSHYKGLGAALSRCHREGMSGSLATFEDKAKLSLTILEKFIDNWDKLQIQDAAEAELIDLFDENMHLGKSVAEELDSQSKRNLSSSKKEQLQSSDATKRFSEAMEMLKHQHQYIAFDYQLSRRFNRVVFAERLCWKIWMDWIDVSRCDTLWERCLADGGRDFGSKLATLPMFPQFPRFIPSYLDHSPCERSNSANLDDRHQEEQTVNLRSSLVQQGIKIVDITKMRSMSEEILERLDTLNEMDGDVTGVEEGENNHDDLDVMFPENPENRRESIAQTESEQNFGSFEVSVQEEYDEGSSPTQEEVAEDEGKSLSGQQINLLQLPEGNFHFAPSSFSFQPDINSLHSMGRGVRLGGGSLEEYYGTCVHVKPEWSRKCILLLTDSHLVLEYDDGDGFVEGEKESKRKSDLSGHALKDHDEVQLMNEALRPKTMRWNISETSHIYLRRYRLRDSALELFFIPSAGAMSGGSAFFAGSRSLFIDFGAGSWGNTRRDDAANAIMKRAPVQAVKQWPDKSGQFLHDELKKFTHAWSHGAISNFDYLMGLNCLAGRSFNDICQYPVMPWVLSNYTSEEVPDLTDAANFRDLSKPIGALNEQRLEELLERFNSFEDPTMPPFMYGSHYSTSAGVVCHFLLRLHPFASLHRHLQSGHFDVADRLFSSIQRTWDMCTGRSAAEVKELTPEFYCNPAFLRNTNELKLGTMQDGEVLGDVVLPPWAKGSPEKFVEVMRLALESDVCSEMLPAWIDLIFGKKQQGKAAIEANNVFFYLTYYGSVDVASIEDEALRHATELQIAHFGQCPMQLFYRSHANKRRREISLRSRRQTLSNLYGLNSVALLESSSRVDEKVENEESSEKPSEVVKQLPFSNAPISYWVHLGAPPPGPHTPLISIRLALSDRCMAVDSNGIFHFFRWAWKPEFKDESSDEDNDGYSSEESCSAADIDIFRDSGCFVAQRELFSFRVIPRLPFATAARNVIVSVSQTLFANRTLLLVLSDGDGKGALAMQLVDPVKGVIRGEVIVPAAHADRITTMKMDPIGTAAGQGGVGGELAIVGSADGSISLWRFISSHFWPLRPRLRMMGHGGAAVSAVAISSSLGICASVSSKHCCLFDIGNGAMVRKFSPPPFKQNVHEIELQEGDKVKTNFANTQALAFSALGFIVAVCSTKVMRKEELIKELITIELFTLEGWHVSTQVMRKQDGVPKSLIPTIDGRAVFVCGGGKISVLLVSTLQPLKIVDEWRLSTDVEDNDTPKHVAYDLDFGPTIARPVVAAAACSEGALRLHALQGISKWSQENQRTSVSTAVGNVLALPAQTVKNALGGVAGFGSKFMGFGKEIGKEAVTAVKEREASNNGGGGFFFRKKR